MISPSSFALFRQAHPEFTTFLIAYSGGMDSHVLLHAMHCIQQSDPAIILQAIHIDHGLSQNASQWQVHCQQVCDLLAIPLCIEKINVEPQKGDSLEACARDKRYDVFKRFMTPQVCLVTAHHQDDQAETLLLQLLRGAGPKGLAGMAGLVAFANGYHWRPLLDCTREACENYAELHQLKWVTDESNSDVTYARNYLRHKVIPLLKSKWPSMAVTMQRSSELCAQAAELLTMVASQDLQQVVSTHHTIVIPQLLLLTPARQSNLIRYWLYRQDLPLPNHIKLQHVLNDVLQAREDANPIVTWPGVEIRRYQQHLYAMPPLAPFDNEQQIHWADLSKPLCLPDNLGQLTALISADNANQFKDKKITIRFRVGGERFHARERCGSHPLKKLFQEWQIPPWQRNRIPLVYADDELICVVDYAHKYGENSLSIQRNCK